MSDYMPNEVLIDILVRVPVKPLLKFRCVSKAWYSLISSPAFINTHINRALEKTNCDGKSNQLDRIFFRYFYTSNYLEVDDHGYHCEVPRSEERFFLYNDDKSFPHKPYMKLRFPYRSVGEKDYFQIVGSVNGIVCLADRNSCTLWNPSVNRAMCLPFAFEYDPANTIIHRLGFGYDEITNDYKVVRLVYFGMEYHSVDPPSVEIFRLSSKSWQKIACPGPMCMAVQSSSSSQTFVSGAFHWIADILPEEGTSCSVILAFDMANEVFHKIPVPSCLAEKSKLNMTLAVFNGLLALVPYNAGYEVGGELYSDSVWIMKEYAVAESWTKLFHIDNEEQKIRRVLFFRKNGEVILIPSVYTKELLSYESNTQQTRDLEFNVGDRYSKKIYSIDTYMESLVLLNVGTVCQDLKRSY